MRLGPVISLVLFVGCAHQPAAPSEAASGQSASKRPHLTPVEMFDRMTASPVLYELTAAKSIDVPLRRFADYLWPEKMKPLEHPFARPDGKGGFKLGQYPFDKRSFDLLIQAEPYFQDRKYAEAARLYEEALKLSPDNYVAWTFLGETSYFQGDHRKAVERYSKAIELNPYDYLAYFFRGDALAAQGKLDEARADYAMTLALNPRNETLSEKIESAGNWDFTVAPPLVQPRAIARKTEKGVQIAYDQSAPAWLLYGICKGLWLGEASHRKEMIDTEEHPFTSTEELECLVATAARYRQMREEGKAGPDPQLERLIEVFEAGLADALFLYEIGSRVFPQIVLTVSPEQRLRVRDYVQRFVLVPRPEQPDAPPKQKKPAREGPDSDPIEV